MATLKSKTWSVHNFVKLTKQQQLRSSGDDTDLGTRERYCSHRNNSQWEVLIRKLSAPGGGIDTRQSSLNSLSIPTVKRSQKTFPTGSTYEGTWNILGMSGYGVYTFPTGAVYEGQFDDGMFHGKGKLSYTNGTVIYGVWAQGELTEKQLIFIDGVEYKDKDWSYAQHPDRRYRTEELHGLQPAGRSNITAEPSREIPAGFYDTGDGYYVPRFKSICRYDNHFEFIRSPSVKEQEWIVKNCRRVADETVGPNPELYDVFYEPTQTVNPNIFTVGDVIETKKELQANELEEAKRWQSTREKSLGFTPWAEYHRNPQNTVVQNTKSKNSSEK